MSTSMRHHGCSDVRPVVLRCPDTSEASGVLAAFSLGVAVLALLTSEVLPGHHVSRIRRMVCGKLGVPQSKLSSNMKRSRRILPEHET